MDPQNVATVALIVLMLTNVLKDFVERYIKTTNPLHDAVMRLVPLTMGTLGMLITYLLTSPAVTAHGAMNAILVGILGSAGALAAYGTNKRQEAIAVIGKIIDAVETPDNPIN